MREYPLTETQLGMFLEWNADRASTRYNVACVHKLPKTIDRDRLEKALLAYVAAHPICRTRVVERDGAFMQVEDDSLTVKVERLSMTEEEADAYEREGVRPFDLLAGPLCRFAIIDTPLGCRLFVDMFHTITDGSAQCAFCDFVSAAYSGKEPPKEEVAFADYAIGEAESFNTPAYAEAAAECRRRFAGRSMTTVEPNAGAVRASANEVIRVWGELPRAAIDAFCANSDIHPNFFLTGVFARTLALFANEKDAVFFTVNHGRRDARLRRTAGALVKTLPVLGEMSAELPLSDFLRSFRQHNAGAYPFTHFCRDLGVKPGWGFVYQIGTNYTYLNLGGVTAESRLITSGGAGEMPVLQVHDGAGSYRLEITCAPGRHDEAFLRRFVERFAVISRNFAMADANTALGKIPTLDEAEFAERIAASKGDELESDLKKTLVTRFAEVAARSPEATAVVDCETSLNYGELCRRADALAAELIRLGVKPGDFVGLMLPRRVSFAVAMLAVEKCGAGYVPMDAEYPPDRLAYMLENSGAPVMITTRAVHAAKSPAYSGKVLFFEDAPTTGAAAVDRSTPEGPAYMIYTSGSTGRPKGVVLPNRALAAMAAWFAHDFGIGPGSVNLSIASFSFDASVPDLVVPLATGGAVHILSEEQRKDLAAIRDYAVRVGATGVTASTQLGLALINAYPELPLGYMMLGGEKMVPFARTPVRIVNGYGPTEFAVCSSYHEVDQTKAYDIPIGRAVANTWSLVVDKLGQIVPRGMAGEIALAGPQLADGYWQLPEKTASAFVEGPLGRMYLTGDLARYDDNNELEFLGRIDFQVKLRGFRIEIGEIEHVAASFPGVSAVAAEVREVAGTKHLVLYYAGSADSAALKAKMAESLTDYMVPEFLVRLEELPLTPNGKIDRRRLPSPELEDEPTVAPANERERTLLATVAEVLGTDRFGVTHDFNRLGLTSLGAMTLLAKLKKQLGLSVTMRQLADNPTVRALSSLVGGATARAEAKAVKRRPARKTYPLSENQRGVYADWLRNPGALQYNVPAVFKFRDLGAEALAEAAMKVFAAHPAFMTRFGEKDGEIVQFRHDDARIAVEVEKLDFEPDAAYFTAQMRPFAPEGEDLARGRVYATKSAAYLFIDIHHTIFDGFSVGVFLSELMRALDGQEPTGEAYTAFDAALDERDYLESELLEDDDKWFERYVDGVESTRFETSSIGADGKIGEVGRVAERVAADAVKTRCASLGVTASDYFLTVFTELLKRVGRSEDVLINFVTAGRGNPETAETVGMFVRTLPLKGIKGASTFTEAARRMHESVSELIDRERHSFVRLSERLGLRPDILFAFEGGIFDLPRGAELISPSNGTAKTPLSVVVTPGRDDFELAMEYDRSLYSERDIAALASMFRVLSENAAKGDDLKALKLVSSADEAKLLELSAGETIAYDPTRTFVNLFHAQAIVRPFAKAVVAAGASLTYGELEARSDALAKRLISLGVKPGDFVGLMLPRRVEFPLAFLAVQKCGAGYVPMDAEYPDDRLAYMLEDSRAPVLVTTHELMASKNLDFAGEVVCLDELPPVAEGDTRAVVNHSTPESPAYMIYTSGSTGKPKGVVIPNRALAHFCAWTIAKLELAPSAKVATHPSFSFDASVMDLFPALAAGAELHIYPEELRKDLPGMRDYIIANGITGGTMSTQIGMTLLDTYPDLPLRYLVVGGEKLLPTAPTAIRIMNGYGPTEFTVASSMQPVTQPQDGDIPIGRPVPGTSSFIVDRYGQLLPRGFAGEIALMGPQLADGYWRLPEKTASVFVEGPYGRMYRTGDLARYNDSGLLEYLGRIDFQVKLRGFRIEIGEIEQVAAAYPGIGAVAAEVREVAGVKHLVLYYAAEAELDETALKAKMASSLAAYMVPDFFVRMPALPLTPNGKINRKLLPAPSGDAPAEEYVEPANDTERSIAEAYGEILKVERYGATQDFFLAGGTSLLGIKAVVALQKRGLDVAYGDLFKYKTPRELAAFITGESAGGERAPTAEKGGFDYGDYDYSAIDAALAATPTELFEGFRRHSLGDVLLAGATGYLGMHVLKRLLETTDSTVYALVRPRRGTGGERRLDAQYVYYFGERIPRRYRDRLAFVEGDITDTDLGRKLDGLAIGTVFNCAAMVKHYVADDAMDRINVGGVENLIRWCEKSGSRLVHVSTYSIGGTVRADSAAMLDERRLYLGQESDNDYVRTKFLAERAVLAADVAGRIRAKIMRLGNLMGRESDGEFQMNVGANAFVNSLKSYKALGAYPLEELVHGIEMSPIDRVAEAICLLATTPDGMRVFHPFNCYRLDMGAVVGAMNRRGYAVDAVSRADFAAHVDALRNDPAHAGELQGILHYAGHLLKDRKMTPVMNDWTTTVLYRLGFRWRPADDSYLASFLEMLDGLAVFD